MDNPLQSLDEEPVLLNLTAVESGISLISVEFQPDMNSDEVLLSGFLAAFRSMSDLMFQLSFDEVRFGEYTLLMKVESPFLISYIFRGRTQQAGQRLEELITTLREHTAFLDSFKNTISTGVVDKIAKALVRRLTTQIFTNSEGHL